MCHVVLFSSFPSSLRLFLTPSIVCLCIQSLFSVKSLSVPSVLFHHPPCPSAYPHFATLLSSPVFPCVFHLVSFWFWFLVSPLICTWHLCLSVSSLLLCFFVPSTHFGLSVLLFFFFFSFFLIIQLYLIEAGLPASHVFSAFGSSPHMTKSNKDATRATHSTASCFTQTVYSYC